MNDLWFRDLNNSVWIWEAGSNTRDQSGVYGSKGVAASSNTPGARTYQMTWMDDGRNRMYMFGGEGYDSAGVLGHLNDRE
jgi:hypothetical protein